MQTLVEFVVRIANLLEAEGRLAKHHVVNVVVVSLVFLAATVLLVAAALVLVCAAYLGLRTVMPPAWAAALMGFVLLVAGLVCAIVGRALLSRRPRRGH